MPLKTRLKNFVNAINRHEIFTLSGSLAYTTALALAPFTLILLTFASFLSQEMQEKIYRELAVAIGPRAGLAIIEIIDNAQKNSSLTGISGIIGFVILIITASAIFVQLRVALNRINEHDYLEDKFQLWNFIRERFLSMGLVLGFTFLSIASLIASTALAVFLPGQKGIIMEVVFLLFNLVIFSVLFIAIFRFIPSDKMEWERCKNAGIISAVFYLIGKNFISLYLAHAGLETSYGAAGSLVAFLVWVYYTTFTLLVSYEFTRHVWFARASFHSMTPEVL